MAIRDETLDHSQLPKAKGWYKSGITQYQGSWFKSDLLPNVISFQKNFQSHDQDIIIASNPKSGTTWLKALLFSIANRTLYSPSNTPLLTSNPHSLIPTFEFSIFSDPPSRDLSEFRSPRILSTHVPHSILPESIVDPRSKCRIVYICRNPLDYIVSFWEFMKKGYNPMYHESDYTLEAFVESFCEGEIMFGPFWDHVLGFWKASLENPEKVLFLKYEDMLDDTVSHAKRLADFIGFPFSEEEERDGVVEQIIELCSLKSLKELEVNKHGSGYKIKMDYKNFFRKGEVGDWINHLTPSMVEIVRMAVEEKLCGSGLTFKYKT